MLKCHRKHSAWVYRDRSLWCSPSEWQWSQINFSIHISNCSISSALFRLSGPPFRIIMLFFWLLRFTSYSPSRYVYVCVFGVFFSHWMNFASLTFVKFRRISHVWWWLLVVLWLRVTIPLIDFIFQFHQYSAMLSPHAWIQLLKKICIFYSWKRNTF